MLYDDDRITMIDQNHDDHNHDRGNDVGGDDIVRVCYGFDHLVMTCKGPARLAHSRGPDHFIILTTSRLTAR